MATETRGNRVLLAYGVGRTFRRALGFLALAMVLAALYLEVFHGTRGGGSPDLLGHLIKKLSAIQGAGLCRKLSLEGVRFADQGRLGELIGRYCGGENFSLRDLKIAILEDPWISRVHVHRTIPSTLEVLVAEHNPFAIFSSDYKSYILVNEFGEKINIPEKDVANFSHLFLVVDDSFNSQEIGKMFNLLSLHSTIAQRVSALIRVGNRRWDLRLRNNVLVKMPEDSDHGTEAWTALANLLDVYGLDIDLEEIDLRVERKVFLRYRAGTKEKIDKFSKKSAGQIKK
ncbi:MAG: cell division protein FtsQ/DivIB [Rickettsiales bacterium]|jgi:hypothetical protein|nr:cell division protein FtsQ/DivIB [Rickettsiales bacterium]